ncbi:Cytochrome c-like protein domain-containing protein [Aromatoleum petrolei]|nr:Cytochrome c-like protein domain-containing protein [Aromatoleum petrolei]
MTLTSTPAFPDAMPGGNRHLGQYIFRFDTFGDQQLWTTVLRMHEVIPAAVSPATALAVGLKVDATALPRNFFAKHDLNDPRTTVELLRRNAVVGVVGKVKGRRLVSVGITCALCHSTVDNSVAPGVGKRLDGWPNLDLNPGAIIALSPALPEDRKAVYSSWGPGRYDPRFSIDGINGPLVIPPAYGLAGVPFETFSGDGPISYWNNYVAVTQMGGHGNFSDPRLGITIEQTPDLVTSKLPELLAYQLSLPAPRPAEGSVDAAAAQRGAALFNGTARCGTCHIPPTYTDVHNGSDADTPLLHDPSETGMDPGYARRTATGKYRSTPLRALWQHPPYFHDGSAPTLGAVVDHYDTHFALGLTPEQKADLVEFLKSL